MILLIKILSIKILSTIISLSGQNHQFNPRQNSVADNYIFGDNNNNLDAQNNNHSNFFGQNHQFNSRQNSVADNHFFGDDNNNLDGQTRILIAAQLQNIVNQFKQQQQQQNNKLFYFIIYLLFLN